MMAHEAAPAKMRTRLGDDLFILSLSEFPGTRFPTGSFDCGDDSQVVGATRPCDLPFGPGRFKGGFIVRPASPPAAQRALEMPQQLEELLI